MSTRAERVERAEQAADAAAQETAGATAHDIGVQSPGYVMVPPGMYPDHGEAVTFVPGEMLPAWAADALADQRPEPDTFGTYRLTAPVGRRKPPKATT
jgi:hypothetical protein